jgi:hypothetical protein
VKISHPTRKKNFNSSINYQILVSLLKISHGIAYMKKLRFKIEVPEPERIGTDKKRSSSTSERGVREHFYYMLLSS